MLETAFVAARDHEPFAGAKICAILVRRNRIVSFGFNRKKTHPLQALFGKNEESIYLHAEIDAIVNALHSLSLSQLSECSLYIARSTKLKRPAIAKPCPGCQRAIEYYGITLKGYTQ